MKRVLLVFLSVLLSTGGVAHADSDPLDAPPGDLSPTAATVGEVLRRYDAAHGILAAGLADTRVERWNYTSSSLPGSELLVRSGQDYYARIATGTTVDEYGEFFGKYWHRDRNGVVSAMRAPDYAGFEAVLFMHGFQDASDPKNDVKVAGESGDPGSAYVLQVKAPGAKHPEFMYFDKATGLIDKIVRVYDDTRYTFVYDRYRTTKGLNEPWHIHVTSGDALLDDDYLRETLALGEPIPPKRFAIPASSTAFASYSGAGALPAKVVFDYVALPIHHHDFFFTAPNVVLRLMVKGRGLDFALSCGQSDTLIDFDVAQELGLSGYGQVTRDKHGDPVPYDTVIPDATLGGMALHNLAARALPFHYHVNDETKIVGVVGYDVLSTGVFKVDFENGTVNLYPANAFDSNPPVQESFTLPLTFDDGRPFMSTQIAGHSTDRILVDNDFEYSVIFGDFMQRYPDAVENPDGGAHTQATLPFADSHDFGRDTSVWRAQVPALSFGPATFVNYHLMADDEQTDGIDAVLGGDMLRFYDMYLDYPHSRIILKPNKSFFKEFKVNGK